jgi:drug/metabolite transporter (DMT)-like permease
MGWAWAALVLALAGVAFLVVGPASRTESVEVSVDPGSGQQHEVRRSGTQSLLESEGASVLGVLAVPVILSGVGVVGARRASRRLLTVVVAVYGVGLLLALASIGLFFVPSFLALLFARGRLG